VWDGAASIAIGGVLVVAAVRLGMDSRDLLSGKAAGPREQRLIRDEDVADHIDRRLSDKLPAIPPVFIDPTQAPAAAGRQ
jgi:hypothetical protein